MRQLGRKWCDLIRTKNSRALASKASEICSLGSRVVKTFHILCLVEGPGSETWSASGPLSRCVGYPRAAVLAHRSVSQFAIIAAPSRSAANANATKSRHMPPSLIRIQRLFIIAEYLIHMTAQGSRSAIRGKRSDEVAADDDRRIMAAAARHVRPSKRGPGPATWSA